MKSRAEAGRISASVDSELGSGQSLRGYQRHPAGVSQRRRAQILSRHHPVDHPNAQSLGGVDHVAEVQQLAGPLEADDPRHHQARARIGEPDLGFAEPCVVSRDGDVAQQGDLAPSAQGVALHGGDHRLAQVPVLQHELQALVQHGVPAESVVAVAPVVGVGLARDVEAHAEAPALRAQQHHAGGLVGFSGPQRVPPGVHERRADGVELVLPVDGDDADRAVGLMHNTAVFGVLSGHCRL